MNVWPAWKWRFKVAFALVLGASTAAFDGILAALIAVAVYGAVVGYQFKRDRAYRQGKTEKTWSPWSEPPR